MAKKKKNSFRRRGPRLFMGWQNISVLCGSQSGDEDGLAGLASGENLIPQAATQLDFGRKRWVKLIRLILRVIIVVIGDGAALRNVRVHVGVRIRGVDQADTVGDNPGLLGTEANDSRVDWLYRDCFFVQVDSTSPGVQVIGHGGGTPVIDFKPGRRMGPEQQLVFHWHTVLSDTDSTNFDGTQTCRLEGRALWGSPS